MKEGDTVYDIDGNQNILVAAIPGRGFIVEPVYEGPDEAWSGDPMFIKRVFTEPPKARIDKELAASQAALTELRSQVADETRRLKDLREGYEKRLARLSERDKALRRIEDFLDGKTSHYVMVYWNEIKILSQKESACESDKHATKLLTLFGKTGSLEWNLNQYSDGSGSNYICYPCCSIEDAVTKVAELIQDAVDDWRGTTNRSNMGRIQAAKKTALAYCLEFPADVAEDLSARVIAEWEKSVAAKQDELNAAQQKLDELRKGLAT